MSFYGFGDEDSRELVWEEAGTRGSAWSQGFYSLLQPDSEASANPFLSLGFSSPTP